MLGRKLEFVFRAVSFYDSTGIDYLNQMSIEPPRIITLACETSYVMNPSNIDGPPPSDLVRLEAA
jgi:hypothetical protein